VFERYVEFGASDFVSATTFASPRLGAEVLRRQYRDLADELGAGAAPEALAAGATPPTNATEKPFTPLPVTSPAFVSPCQ